MNLENHMIVGNKDPKPLKCPECGELADGKFVDKVIWDRDCDVIVKEKTDATNTTDAFECICGCVFNDEMSVMGHTHG